MNEGGLAGVEKLSVLGSEIFVMPGTTRFWKSWSFRSIETKAAFRRSHFRPGSPHKNRLMKERGWKRKDHKMR
jgi:hypothetical protein